MSSATSSTCAATSCSTAVLACSVVATASCSLNWPPAPRYVQAKAAGDDVVITWDPVPGAHGYLLLWATLEDPFSRIVEDATSPFLHATRPASTLHCYTVLAVSAFGTSWSGAESASTKMTTPP